MHSFYTAFETITKEKLISVEPITGSGSNRQYIRLKGNTQTLIGVVGENVEENIAFIKLTKHFCKQNLPVPQVLYVSEDKTQYLQQDLGNVSLFDYINSGRTTGTFNENERNMLKKTIKKLAGFQIKAAEGLDFSICYPQAEFDKRTVLWDLNYFKYCFLKPSGVSFLETKLEDDFEAMAKQLLQEKTNTFLYRDFQSRNVMIHHNEPYFIDYQGGRKGPIYYDVASFLWQAKANFSAELRNELIEEYLQEAKQYQTIDEAKFKQQLKHFVLFRILQVLGAYGYRGFFERKTHFIESVPFAIENLRNLLKNDFSEYPYLISVLKEICSSTSLVNHESTHIIADNANCRKDKNPCESPLSPSSSLKPSLHVTIFSFSYKNGIPEDTSGNGGGYVFDCRAIHNPGRYEEYKHLTGLDKPVIEFLEKDGEIITFLNNIYVLADAHISRYIERGFTNLMFSFGCTGGQHRSVYSAQHLAEYVRNKYNIKVTLNHREQTAAPLNPPQGRLPKPSI
jgi:aminoglycoside/choline kinase family phosphotransferase